MTAWTVDRTHANVNAAPARAQRAARRACALRLGTVMAAALVLSFWSSARLPPRPFALPVLQLPATEVAARRVAAGTDH